MSSPTLILTFDIEDWFHILDNEGTDKIENWSSFESRVEASTDRILEFLQARQLRATFFCLGWVAETTPNIIKKIANAGHEIGSHTYSHQLVYQLGHKAFIDDLSRSIKLLEDVSGQKVRSFRAPGFSFNRQTPWAFETLLEHGIEFDSSVFPAKHGHGGYAEFPANTPVTIKTDLGELKEFPINTATLGQSKAVFSGGGYFRLLPYQLIKLLSRKHPLVMTYFHPRDFDTQQPLLPGLTAKRRFKSYYGIKGAFNKLDKYVRDFTCCDLAGAAELIDWDKTETVNL